MPMQMTAWESTATEAGICAYFLLILSFLSALLAVRLYSVGSFRGFIRLRLARQLIIFTLIDSWLFCWASAVILFGVGSAFNHVACEIGIWWCIALYASSKIMIYLFLMERLNVVHSSVRVEDGVTLKDRFRSWWYRIASVLVLCWVIVGIVMCVGRNATLKSDGTCKIGLKIWATVPMLTVDVLVNIFLTAGFIVPVLKSGFNKAKTLVRTSCIAAIGALVTSFANIVILAIMKGHQHSWLCLTSCVTDVAINAAILFFITRYKRQDEFSTDTLQGTSKRMSTNESACRGGTAGHLSCEREAPSRRVSWALSPHKPCTTSTYTVPFEGIAFDRIEECTVDIEKSLSDKEESDYEATSPPSPVLPANITRSFGSITAAERQAIAPFADSLVNVASASESGPPSSRRNSSSPSSRRGSSLRP